MAEKLTAQQLQAVTNRGGKLLVSAAAGSGKTKVLVDRLMSYLVDPADPANLDDFLIITYTKAAAAELRGKIAAKLTERIAEEPSNRHIQQQMQRLYLTKISTVHSFCTDILREHAYKLDISADFRMADESEAVELQIKAMDQVLNTAYENAEEHFLAFIDTQGLGRDDHQVPQIVLEVYQKAKCHLDPDEWLESCVSAADITGVTDASQTVWGAYLMDDLRNYVDMQILALSNCARLSAAASYMEKPTALLNDTIDQLRALRNSATWNDVIAHKDIAYGSLRFDKKCDDLELIERIKAIRDTCKEGLAKRLRRFSNNSEQILSDIASTSAATKGLVTLVKQFSRVYEGLKRSSRIMDFSDLEHKTLDLLLGKRRAAPTAIAAEIGSRYREVMVDEYQDSNAVQDKIFSALSQKKQNCFMVGDVKQSIYQFRLADPGIFLEKYNSYATVDDAEIGQGRKVLLSSNFRSSGGVIRAVNDVFTTCMSPEVGGLHYGDEESLKEGIPHIPLNEPEVELYGIEVKEDTYKEEASFTADRIFQLLDGKHMVRQGDTLRPITPDDIVILLRSPGSVGGDFRFALEQRGIRCVTGNSSDLLQTEEIETLCSLLQIISNPLQDIPLVGVMTSRVFGFSADNLAAVRANDRSSNIYAALQTSVDKRVKEFLDTLKTLRMEARISTLTQLVSKILLTTKLDSIYGAMPDGANRVENIQTFCQLASAFEANTLGDLNRFLEYMANMERKGFTVAQENSTAGAVRIMSIHKSKGLEFPVVFLCGLSKTFNTEDTKAPVLCDRKLGLGLCCADLKNRIRYPTVAKKAISAKMYADSISEEMRVLYVAMTRARDRLIMTYAQKYLTKKLTGISMRMDLSPSRLLTGEVVCAGDWVLLSALQRMEANAFFAVAGRPNKTRTYDDKWSIHVIEGKIQETEASEEIVAVTEEISEETIFRMQDSLAFQYPYSLASKAPSKQTATQLKGRFKDREAAEGAEITQKFDRTFRKPSFITVSVDGKNYGNALHAVMQYIRYEACADATAVKQEIARLVHECYISPEQGELADANAIADFFATQFGEKLRQFQNPLREFKFSILDEGSRYCTGMENERVLLQGVVDCALVEDNGITVVDFKTDQVTEETLPFVVERYRPQVEGYAYAMERIYQKPVKSAMLYFFRLNRFVNLL